MELFVGDKVNWQSGSNFNKGVFLEDLGNGFSKVVCHLIGNRYSGIEMEVLSSILKKGW